MFFFLAETFDQSGKLLAKNQVTTFIVGAGNFNGKSKPSDKVVSTVSAPNRRYDKSVQLKTNVDQAALYRMSGDVNPLHIDPDFAKIGGQPVPILHGLCTLGEKIILEFSLLIDFLIKNLYDFK